MTTLTIGESTREIFLEDFSWQLDAGEASTPLGRSEPFFFGSRQRNPDVAVITILFTSFTEARQVSNELGNGQRASLIESALSLAWVFRATGQINIDPARIGDEIKAWRLTLTGVSQ